MTADRAHMEIVPGHAALSRRLRTPVIAVGNFDGVHRGHAFLFAETMRRAAALGGEAVVFTFDPHPARVLSSRPAPPLITTNARKLALIAGAGIDVCVLEPFTDALALLSPDEFVDRMLVEALGAREVCVGYDFNFGRNRAGDAARLRAIGESRGFGVTVIDPVAVDGVVCSSTRVRGLVQEGRVSEAARLLGRDFEVDGQVERGAGRGRSISVPTANLAPQTELLPARGVYAGWAELPSGVRYAAAINIGSNPTFHDSDGDHRGTGPDRGGAAVTVEAHLIDFDGDDFYGSALCIGFSERLRDEARFQSIEALVAQIGEDVEAARERFRARRTEKA